MADNIAKDGSGSDQNAGPISQDYILASTEGEVAEVVNTPSPPPYATVGDFAAPTGQKTRIKLGHKCCGGCCDMRRAVVIVNSIDLCFFIVMLGLLINFYINGSTDPSAFRAELVFMLGRFVCFGSGILGAYYFNVYMVGLAAAAYALECLLGVLSLDPLAVVWAGGFLYPHVFLIKELGNGIMTPDNYPNEQQSCCCV